VKVSIVKVSIVKVSIVKVAIVKLLVCIKHYIPEAVFSTNLSALRDTSRFVCSVDVLLVGSASQEQEPSRRLVLETEPSQKKVLMLICSPRRNS
jgi:hypothetical protein